MHSKSDIVAMMVNDKEYEVIEEFFQSLSRYQLGWEILIEGSDFIFNCVHLLHYKCHKINLNVVDCI